MISLVNFEPAELGLPEKFKEFRPAQIEAIEKIVNSNKRFTLLDLPTGSGKTLVGMGAANVMGARAAFITSTLGLQHQYSRDFRSMGLCDIRGRANYDCNSKPENCKLGPHAGCPHISPDLGPTAGCSYGMAKFPAMASKWVVTNYAYWIRIGGSDGLSQKLKDSNEPKNPIQLLILDEAHRAHEELSRTLQLTLNEGYLRKFKLDFRKTDDIGYWQDWAVRNCEEIKANRDKWAERYKEDHGDRYIRQTFRDIDFLAEFTNNIKSIRPEAWVCEMRDPTFGVGRSWAFDPIWPANWAHKLFGDVPRVVLMSATLRPITARMLGIEKGDYDFFDWPRVFPAQRTPIYHIPTVRMNFRATADDMVAWVNRIDEIIEGRLDRKGLIHTVSYTRQQYLLEHSKFAHLMVRNSNKPDTESAAQVCDTFKAMDAPALLVSPSYSTGWDFPDDECRYQIIAKLPFPDTRNKLTQARLERNAQYVNSLCMQDLQQSAGRGTRSEDDWCEVFIVDDSVGWFMMQNKSLASRWFNIQTILEVPKPLCF